MAGKVSTQIVLSVLDKAENGPLVDENEWDRFYIYETIKELATRYDVRWQRDRVLVPADDALADRTFLAGLELACRSGLYCKDTRRRMAWSEAELQQVMEGSPAEVTVGSGSDTATLRHRRPEDPERVAVIGGAYGILVSEELFIPMMMSYAQEPVLEMIENASLETTCGRPIRANSAWDVVAGWQEVELTFETLRLAGRPGLAVGCANSSASMLCELTTTSYGGFRQTDWHHNSMMSELKISYGDLIRAAHFNYTGAISHNFYNPIYGGYVGGGAGLAIAMVAGMILLRAALWGESVNPGPSHAHLSGNTFPEMIAAQAVAFQALSRNTRLLTAVIARPVAGPGVIDLFYESAAVTIAGVVSGVALAKGVQSAAGRFARHCSGLEARFMGQVAHAVEGMSRRDADAVVRWLAARYQPKLIEVQIGSPFELVYDIETVRPTPHWQTQYDQSCLELQREFGLALN